MYSIVWRHGSWHHNLRSVYLLLDNRSLIINIVYLHSEDKWGILLQCCCLVSMTDVHFYGENIFEFQLWFDYHLNLGLFAGGGLVNSGIDWIWESMWFGVLEYNSDLWLGSRRRELPHWTKYTQENSPWCGDTTTIPSEDQWKQTYK